jgi:lipoyl(octanoyl) transferase
MNRLLTADLGSTRYADAWDLQKKVFNARKEGIIPDILLFTEHHHVYTLGKGTDANHLLAGEDELRNKGIDVFEIDRGGDITYHGPGQLVGYPIIDLNDHYLDIHRYLRDIEEVLIQSLMEIGIDGSRSEGYTGVWTGADKIAAIGVKVSRWITMHGFALNVNTDLLLFDRIIPCGIFHKGITSIQQEMGMPADMEEIKKIIMKNFAEIFGLKSESIDKNQLLRLCEAVPTHSSSSTQ